MKCVLSFVVNIIVLNFDSNLKKVLKLCFFYDIISLIKYLELSEVLTLLGINHLQW